MPWVSSANNSLSLKSYESACFKAAGFAIQPTNHSNMKTYNPIVYIFSLVCACLVLIGCETTQQGAATAPPPPNSARLHVDRVANFGSDLVLVLSVDGKDVGSFTEGASYNGYLSAGQHTIVARVSPNESGVRSARKTLNVTAGQTYSYTAGQSGGRMTLVRNQGQSVPVY
jgi:hypothetical protein